MRPPMHDGVVEIVRSAIPEFEDWYLDLADIYDENLSPILLFNEFAEFVTAALQASTDEDLLERCFSVVETVALAPTPDGRELIGLGFLDQLPPMALERARAYFGPATEALWQSVESEDGPEAALEDDGEIALLACERE